MRMIKYYLLSITGEFCEKCKGNKPWSYRAQVLKEGNGTISDYEIICANCIDLLSQCHLIEIYDALLKRHIFPGDHN